MTLDISAAPIASDTTDHAPPPAAPRPPTGTGPGRRVLLHDLPASLAVFLIAVPFSLGIALATGAPLTAGLVAAAAGGLVAGLLGGTPPGQRPVGRPDRDHRRRDRPLRLAGGLRRDRRRRPRPAPARRAEGRPGRARGLPAVVHGMLAGVGLTIAIAQLHVVLGGSPQSSALDNLIALPHQISGPHLPALAVGAVAVATLFCWPRLGRLPGHAGLIGRRLSRLPAALVAVAAGTALSVGLGLRLARVELPSWSQHALAAAPSTEVLAHEWPALLAVVLTVAAVAGVESLLSSVAVDRMSHSSSDLDRELRGQGLANMVSGLCGGLPVAGGAVRSTANVQAGAVSRWSAVLHGCWVVLAALALAGGLRRIPLAALAALVLVVGIQMVSFAHIRRVHRHREFPVYLATVVGVVVLGVPLGVAAGGAVAATVALYRLTRAHVDVTPAPDGVVHVRTHGPLTFAAVPKLARALAQIPRARRSPCTMTDPSWTTPPTRPCTPGGPSTRQAAAGSPWSRSSSGRPYWTRTAPSGPIPLRPHTGAAPGLPGWGTTASNRPATIRTAGCSTACAASRSTPPPGP
ncbi:hypothetical protein GCM10025734_41470 [Kitasatospora paranensis]